MSDEPEQPHNYEPAPMPEKLWVCSYWEHVGKGKKRRRMIAFSLDGPPTPQFKEFKPKEAK